MTRKRYTTTQIFVVRFFRGSLSQIGNCCILPLFAESNIGFYDLNVMFLETFNSFYQPLFNQIGSFFIVYEISIHLFHRFFYHLNVMFLEFFNSFYKSLLNQIGSFFIVYEISIHLFLMISVFFYNSETVKGKCKVMYC